MLWGAFNNASSAMQAMSWDMGSISQNIANVNTTGYKRKETLFQTVMSESHAAPSSGSGPLNIFGVQTADRYHIAAQGVIAPSGFGNDLAINGSGFFMVAQPDSNGAAPATVSTDDPRQVLYTRDGGFHNVTGPDEESYFVSGSGHYLLGWMADDNGVVTPGGALEPVYTKPGTLMLGRATETAKIMANIPSDAQPTANVFTTDANVTDPNTLLDHAVTLTWSRVDGTNWTVTPSMDAAIGNVTSGSFNVECDSLGVIYSASGADAIALDWTSGVLTSTADLLGPATTTTTPTVVDPLNVTQNIQLDWTRIDGNVWSVVPTLPAGLGTTTIAAMTVAFDGLGRVMTPQDGKMHLDIDWDDTAYGTASSETSSIDLANFGPTISLTKPEIHVEKIAVPVFDSEFQSHDVVMAFERTGADQWYVHTYSRDADAGATAPTAMAVRFDGNGQMITPDDGLFSADWTWGTGTGATEFDMAGISQYNGELYIRSVNQDGYGEGTLLRAGFNEVGEMSGYFTNGETLTLFKLPLAQFVSENRLDPISGNLFARSVEAGEMTVTAAEDAVGETRFVAGSLETSTVDIEDEFTKMIVTQKAYSTNAQVFRTADEMTTTARDLKA